LQEDRQDFRQKTLKEQEERIAGELHRRKIEEFRDEKLVQKIRESSEELRELEEKLKAAYCTKERKAQIEEKQIVAQIRGEEEVGPPLPSDKRLFLQRKTQRTLAPTTVCPYRIPVHSLLPPLTWSCPPLARPSWI